MDEEQKQSIFQQFQPILNEISLETIGKAIQQGSPTTIANVANAVASQVDTEQLQAVTEGVKSILKEHPETLNQIAQILSTDLQSDPNLANLAELFERLHFQ